MPAKIVDLRNNFALWDTVQEEGASFEDFFDPDRIAFLSGKSTPIIKNKVNAPKFAETHVGVDWESIKNNPNLRKTVEEMYLWARLYFASHMGPIVVEQGNRIVAGPGLDDRFVFGSQTCLTRGVMKYSLKITNGPGMQNFTLGGMVHQTKEAYCSAITKDSVYEGDLEPPEEWKEGYEYSLVEPEQKKFEILTNFSYPIVNVDIKESYKLPVNTSISEDVTTDIIFEELNIDVPPTDINVVFETNLYDTLTEEEALLFRRMMFNNVQYKVKFFSHDIENLATQGILRTDRLEQYVANQQKIDLRVIFVDVLHNNIENEAKLIANVEEVTITKTQDTTEIYSKTQYTLTREKTYKKVKTIGIAERIPGLHQIPIVRDGEAVVEIHPDRRGFALTKIKTNQLQQVSEDDYVCDVLFKIQYEGGANV